MKKYLSLILFTCIFSCTIYKQVNSTNANRLIIYHLSSQKNSIVSIGCDKIQESIEVKIETINNYKEVRRIYEMFADMDNFKEDTTYMPSDFRISFVFFKDNSILKKVCWSKVKRVLMNDKCYSYNNKIENLLIEMKLILVVR